MSVSETARKIASMEVRGALRIAVAAAKAMEAEIIDGVTYEELVKAGDELRDARPTAVSLPNTVNHIIHLADVHRNDDPAVAKPLLLADVAGFIAELESSIEEAAENCAGFVEDGDTILTICNSETVVQSIKKAWFSGKRFSVYACETRPRFQGHITAKELTSAGVDVTLIVDSAAYYTIRSRGVGKVMVGADAVYASGDVVNKIGTSQVALAAKDLGVDFTVCTETIKFSPYSLHGVAQDIEERDPSEVADIAGVKVFNPAFDVTPAKHITRIVTEDGAIEPTDARKIMLEKFRWVNETGE